jgi:uncharacterized surface protein with fasciclin (FAS1) repeats
MRKLFLILIVLLALALPALAQERPSVVEVLSGDADGRFTTLLAAVEAAGLVDALSEAEGVTLLAPTNDAFDAALAYLGLSAGELLADTETLTQVLLYHIVDSRLQLRDLTAGPEATTLQGDSVQFALDAGVLSVNGTTISDVDNLASNNVVVHVLEGVLLPPAIAEAVAANRAHIRVAHLSPDAGAVDIYLGGELTDLQGVTFGTVSGWIEIPAGAQQVAIAAAGDEPGGTITRRVEAGTWVTIAAIGVVGADNFDVAFLVEDYTALAEGQARVSVFHAITFAPAVDINVNGSPLIINLGYPGTQGDNDGFAIRDVPAATYDLSVTVFGSPESVVLDAPGVALSAGNNYLIVAAGTPTNPQALVIPTNIAEATGNAG